MGRERAWLGRLSYGARVSLILFLVLGAIISAIEYLEYRQGQAGLRSSAYKQVEQLFALIQPEVTQLVHYQKHDELSHELKRLQSIWQLEHKLTELKELTVLDPLGHVLGHTDPGHHPLLHHYQGDLIHVTASLKYGSLGWHGKVIHARLPLQWQGSAVGQLMARFETQGFRQQLHVIEKNLLFELLILVAASVPLGMLFSHWIAHPINLVSRAVGQIGSGTFAMPELEGRSDEFGRMTRKLVGVDRELHAHHQELKREISTRIDAESRLRSFKTTLDLTLDCVFIFEPDSLKFIYVNQGSVQQVDYGEAELLEMTPVDIKPDYDEPRFRELLAPLRQGCVPYLHFETRHRHRRGGTIPVEVFLQYIESENLPPRYIAIVRDISERRAVETELRQYRENLEALVKERTNELELARDVAEQASRAKTEFLSRMSHELRTPMNAVLGFAQLLETDTDESLEPYQRENVTEILDAGQHLLTLINEALDLSCIESGRLQISCGKVCLEEVVVASLKLVQAQAVSHGVQIENTVHACDEAVYGDFTRLQQVLVNLLSNAIKYNKRGGRVEVSCQLGTSGCLLLTVADTGKGIRSDDLERLFTPFERLDVTHNVEGTGIGLAISRHLVEMMGGSISVQSTYGEGSAFSVALRPHDGSLSEDTGP